jgi:signal transduction histidine kinase
VSFLRLTRRPGFTHALRVAAVAALLIGAVYTACVVAIDLVLTHRVTAQTDAQLRDRLQDQLTAERTGGPRDKDHDDEDIDVAPVFVWSVTGHRVVSLDPGSPTLPLATALGPMPATVRIGSSTFRLDSLRSGSTTLVAGESLADGHRVLSDLVLAALLAGPVVLVAVFLGSLVIGLKALAPVEESRRRQLEFTADASHELRTPLSVIQAEVDLALSGRRSIDAYRSTLERVGGEAGRLRHIVEDLLWLARFDSRPPPPSDEPIDLATIAEGCAERFAGLAAGRGATIEVAAPSGPPAWIQAPPEWIDRLAGVLVDNAVRFAGDQGTVRIMVGATGNRVSLVVEDSGPGIPPEERPRMFDRFHRAGEAGGTGLGLAIADSVVRSTGGRWSIGDSDLGGARLEVSWHRPGRDHDHPAGTALPPLDPIGTAGRR